MRVLLVRQLRCRLRDVRLRGLFMPDVHPRRHSRALLAAQGTAL